MGMGMGFPMVTMGIPMGMGKSLDGNEIGDGNGNEVCTIFPK